MELRRSGPAYERSLARRIALAGSDRFRDIAGPSSPRHLWHIGYLRDPSIKSHQWGKRHIEAEVIDLEPGYAGPIEIGATLKFAEDEIVDAYTQPGR